MKHMRISQVISLPKGFQAAGIVAGLKKSKRKDLALLYSECPAVMAGTFTTNQVKAATVKLCSARVKQYRKGRAIVVNSGIANACTGATGYRNAERMAQVTARALGLKPEEVYVCSTGRIGVQLPMHIIEPGIEKASQQLSRTGGMAAAEAIMTTDTRPKYCTARFNINGRRITLAGIAKGAGMIEPKMATMLAFLMTDACVAPAALQKALSAAVDQSFNRITVDGDRSTNDTVLIMANGVAGNTPALTPQHPDWSTFTEALNAVALDLALKMVKDGEGASKFVTVRVRGARNAREADIAARSVANSLLVKTSWVGDYPNWGRIMDALGYSEAKVDESRVDIFYDGMPAARRGVSAGTDIERLKAVQRQKEFTIDIDLHLGQGEAVVYTCDCTEEYVRINM